MLIVQDIIVHCYSVVLFNLSWPSNIFYLFFLDKAMLLHLMLIYSQGRACKP